MGAAETGVITAGLQDEVVLALSREGREELRRPQAGLSLPQRKLLTLIDGSRSLYEIAEAEPTLHADRVHRDAARLLGRGLVEIEQGWLQPITRATTVLPVNTQPPAPAPTTVQRRARTEPRKESKTELRREPVASWPKPKAKPASRGRGEIIWVALAAGGVVAAAAGYFMQQPQTGPAPASATAQPIVTVPAAQVKAIATPRPAETVAAAVPATNAATVPPVPVATVSPPSVSSTPPASASPVRPAAPAAPPPSTSQSAAAAAVTAPGATSTPPQRPAPAVAAAPKPAAVPLPVNRPAANNVAVARAPSTVTTAPEASPPPPPTTTSGDPVAVRPSTAAETVPEVPAWARGFAPVAPEASDTRIVAATSGLSPIERVPPIYPREAAREGITRGSIRARAILAANGSVERVEFPVAEARNRVFERPARAALMTWTFPPGEHGRIYEVVLNFVAP